LDDGFGQAVGGHAGDGLRGRDQRFRDLLLEILQQRPLMPVDRGD